MSDTRKLVHYVRRKETDTGDVQFTLDTSAGDVTTYTNPNAKNATPRPVVVLEHEGREIRTPLVRNIYVAKGCEPADGIIVREYGVESIAPRANAGEAAAADSAGAELGALISAGDVEALAYFLAMKDGRTRPLRGHKVRAAALIG